MGDQPAAKGGLAALFEGMGTALRDAVILTVAFAVVGLVVNLFHPERIPYVAQAEYETLVPCPEPGGEVIPMKPDDPALGSEKTFLIDARSGEAYAAWHFGESMNVTYDYLDPTPDEIIDDLVRRIARSGAQRVAVYGDGDRPDTGEQLGKEISGKGIKKVHFVEGGAPALRGEQPPASPEVGEVDAGKADAGSGGEQEP